MALAAEFFDRLLRDGDFAEQLPSLVTSVDDPLAGHVSAADLRAFAHERRSWLASLGARVQPVRITCAAGREVAELVLALSGEVELPVAVVHEARINALRVYFSRYPLERSHRVRLPIVSEDRSLALPDVVARYQRALAVGDVERVLSCFEPDAVAREPSGGVYRHRGHDALRAFYGALFSSGGGIPLEHCSSTDDGVACAVEYNVSRWGRHLLPPQAGIAVYERGASGLLRAARIYDDVSPPAD